MGLRHTRCRGLGLHPIWRQKPHRDDCNGTGSPNLNPDGPHRRLTEYISGKLLIWAEKRGIIIQHIQPGQPQQNGYIERYNRTVRHEWLDQYIIETIEEAQDHATQWLWTYNNDRPNMGIGGITPTQKLKMAV
jgi:transposase InsO family protein